jgi:hypothetical protein
MTRRKWSIAWDPAPKPLEANIGATVALDQAEWEAAGAHFVATDDGQGEQPGLATGLAQTSSGSLRFAITDYGGDSTYLLVPGDDDALPGVVATLLEAFERSGVLNLPDDVLDTVREAHAPSSLDERISGLEKIVRRLLGVPGLAAAIGVRGAETAVSVVREASKAGESRPSGGQRPKDAQSKPAPRRSSEARAPKRSPAETSQGGRSEPRSYGTVSWVSPDGQYAHIVPDHGEPLLVVPVANFTDEDALTVGARVSFRVVAASTARSSSFDPDIVWT